MHIIAVLLFFPLLFSIVYPGKSSIYETLYYDVNNTLFSVNQCANMSASQKYANKPGAEQPLGVQENATQMNVPCAMTREGEMMIVDVCCGERKLYVVIVNDRSLNFH